jgi:dethiobiotin synthase
MRAFVTGTDTGVGKSVVTAALAAAARARGSVVACKPVASGVAPGSAGEDAELLGFAAGHPPVVFATFEAPLSPHRAAILEGRSVPEDLLDRIAALSADLVLVEGVGGWRVPVRLDPPLWVEDLARAAAGPVVVVAADRLGVLNHALLTVDAVRRAGLPVAAIALNRGAGPPDGSRASNAYDLAILARCPVVPIPPLDPADPAALRSAGEPLLRAIVEAAGR